MAFRKPLAILVCMVLLVTCMSVTVMALNQGAYVGSVSTYYNNPDTGVPDDSAASDPTLGDSMCRSATGTTALVESDGANNWVTLRLLLQSNVNNISIAVRNGYNSYSPVSYEITGSNSGNDSRDFRFQIADPGAYIKCSMYVAPMGRDVVWFVRVNTGSLSAGNGDFNARISAPTPTPATPAPTVAPTQTTQAPNQSTPEVTQTVQPTESAAVSEEQATEVTEAQTVAEEASAESVEPSSPVLEDADSESEKKQSPAGWIAAVAALLLVGGGAFWFVNKKKN